MVINILFETNYFQAQAQSVDEHEKLKMPKW